MDKFYVVTNSQKDKNLEVTKQIQEYLQEKGKDCMIQEQGSGERHMHYRYTDPGQIPDDRECILVLGGDGTLIQAARDLGEKNIPLLGINLGTLGYLAEIEKHGIPAALDKLMLDAYTVEERMMLRGRVFKNKKQVAEDIAINDIVFNRTARILNYEIYVNGEYLNTYPADGVIVSTPTGSTGYSLSAGGPIVSPKASMIILTPICPHTLNTRSIVLAGDDRVVVRLGPGRRNDYEDAVVIFDGDTSVSVGTGDYVEIEKSVQKTSILKISNISFLEVLRNKMNGNQ